MLKELNEKQIKSLLSQHIVGRLGSHHDNETYLMPLNYGYKGGYIHAHSGPGKKMVNLLKNPMMSFEVEQLDSTFQWKCVIARVTFEITEPAEKQMGRQLLTHQLMPQVSLPHNDPRRGITASKSDIDPSVDPIIYKHQAC